jgi:hypothetical protein
MRASSREVEMVATGATWPDPMSEDAFHGLVGEVVHALEPYSEADPAALLIQFLVAVGNLVDRSPHFRAEADRHALNLFTVLVGETSKARKGSSWTHIFRLVSSIDQDWGDWSIQTGLSSGEGLIHAVRDPIEKDDDRLADAGPLDQRLLVVESEFASPLRMIARDGNTLSPIIRQAWDGGKLQVMTKQSPETATKAHISIIGHVTRDELRRELTRTDAGSGFGNRFLWTCVRRSKSLPDGGLLPESEFTHLTDCLRRSVEFARGLGDHEFQRDHAAKSLWHLIYPELSEGKPGLFGAVTSRAEAQVMRLACVYALLDCCREIHSAHLRAADAVWKYCEGSAKYVFGDALGYPLADALHRLLSENPQGMPRTIISNALGRNRTSAEIDAALAILEARGLATSASRETDGRPAIVWHVAKASRVISSNSSLS